MLCSAPDLQLVCFVKGLKIFGISVCTLKWNCWYHSSKQRYDNFLFLVMIVSVCWICQPWCVSHYMETHWAQVTWWHVADTCGQSQETQTPSKLLGDCCCQSCLTWLVKLLNSGVSFHAFDQIMLKSSICWVPLHCSLLSKHCLQGFLVNFF